MFVAEKSGIIKVFDGLGDATPTTFADTPPAVFFAQRLRQLQARNPAEAAVLRRVAISVQGILDRDGHSLKWSPIAHLANRPFAQELAEAFAVPVALHKRGRLLAEGARWLDPALSGAGGVRDLLANNAMLQIKTWSVSRAVNSSRNEGPDLLLPA